MVLTDASIVARVMNAMLEVLFPAILENTRYCTHVPCMIYIHTYLCFFFFQPYRWHWVHAHSLLHEYIYEY